MLPRGLWPDAASLCLSLEMMLLIIVGLSAGTVALGKEHSRPTLPIILTAPLESKEVVAGCFRGLILAILPFVCIPAAHAAVFAILGVVSPYAPLAVLACGLSASLLFVNVGLLSGARSPSLQGGMALAVLLGLATLGILPILAPLVAGSAVAVLFLWSIWRIHLRYFTEMEMEVDGLAASLGCALAGIALVGAIATIWLATGAFLLERQGFFENIGWANPILLMLKLPANFQAGGWRAEAYLRGLLLCCFSSIAAAWGLGVVLRERFDAWTDRPA
jgi:hypothetical protein